jgi:tetratricopeptide (TPR) repeat protein
VLSGGARTALPRQQTLRATLDWSYDLLAARERTIVQRLAVFAGGWTLEAAESVCASETLPATEVLDLLCALVNQSLVLHEEAAGEGRYRLLEIVRQYAAGHLSDAELAAVRDRHLAWSLALAEQAAARIMGSAQRTWLGRLERDLDNMRAALTHSISAPGRAEHGLRLATALWRFWWLRGYASVGRSWLTTLLAQAPYAPAALRAAALTGAGSLAVAQDDVAAGRRLCEEALAQWRALGDRAGSAIALRILGTIAQEQRDLARAYTLYDEALALARELGDRRDIAVGLSNLATVVRLQGDYHRARALYEESLELWLVLGEERGLAVAYGNLGLVAARVGDTAAAIARYEQALQIFSELGHTHGIAVALGNLATACREQGDLARARALYAEALALFRHDGAQGGVAEVLGDLGVIAAAEGESARAIALHEESLALFRELGYEQKAKEQIAHLRRLGVPLAEG